jgi:hypothetical protein
MTVDSDTLFLRRIAHSRLRRPLGAIELRRLSAIARRTLDACGAAHVECVQILADAWNEGRGFHDGEISNMKLRHRVKLVVDIDFREAEKSDRPIVRRTVKVSER